MGLDMYLTAERPAPDLPAGVRTKLNDAIECDDDGHCYVSGYDFRPADERQEYRSAIEAAGLQEFVAVDTPSAYILPGDPPVVRATGAYWRKANAIHAWFVRECQGGVDECQTSDPIARSKLEELLSICRRVLSLGEMVQDQVTVGHEITPDGSRRILEDGEVMANPALAQQLLPTQSGFFFGGTDYDQFYVQDLQSTVEQIERVLKCPADTVFRYRASW